LEDRRISAKSIAEQLGISRERVGFIIHEDLDMLVACFLPGRAKDLSARLYKDSTILLNFGTKIANDFDLQQYRCEHFKSCMCITVIFTSDI
jgi:hypothetical protein